jgi:hypothetical protein
MSECDESYGCSCRSSLTQNRLQIYFGVFSRLPTDGRAAAVGCPFVLVCEYACEAMDTCLQRLKLLQG